MEKKKKKDDLSIKHIALLSIIAIVISIIVLVTGVFMWVQGGKQVVSKPVMNMSIRTTENIREQVTLTDHSKGWLNINTALEYAADYKEDRTIHLSGEGYFKIKMHEYLFTLISEEVVLSTFGATFAVNDYPEKEIKRIMLYSGRVNLKISGLSDVLTLNPGIELLVNKKTGEIAIHTIKQDVKGPEWVSHQFEYTSFDNILYMLSQYYEVTVTNNRPDLNKEVFTLTLDGNMTLEEVMQIMKMISNKFTYKITGDELIIN